jgi:hypothetical protein
VEEFDLAKALDRLAPMLVVLSDPGAADPAVSDTDPVFDSDGDGEADGDGKTARPEFSFEEPDSKPVSTPAFAFEDGSAGASGSMTARRARSQRHQKSALKEMIKVVGGGVIGLTFGQLILWWLPGDWKRDPIDLGPKVPSFLAFVVHPDFRADAVVKKNGEATPRQLPGPAESRFEFKNSGGSELPESSFGGLIDTKPDQDRNKKRNRNKKGRGEGGLPDGTSSGDLSPLKTETQNEISGTTSGIEVPQINLRAFPTDVDGQPSDNDNSIPTIPPPTLDPFATPQPAATQPAATGEFTGVRNAPKISLDQLLSRLAGAMSASVAMDTPPTGSTPSQLSLARDFYVTMAGLGEAITFVDQFSATDEFNKVGKFALEVGKQKAKLDLIGKVAPSWMKNNRPHNGLVVCGVVESIEFTAPYYVTTLVLQNESVHQVVSLNDPSGDYQPQDKILILGSILDTPRQNLENYQGDATTVILDGLHATLPNAE